MGGFLQVPFVEASRPRGGEITLSAAALAALVNRQVTGFSTSSTEGRIDQRKGGKATHAKWLLRKGIADVTGWRKDQIHKPFKELP